MAVFKKTTEEIVDGRQFTGGAQNGTDLTNWCESGGQRALWASPFRKAHETILLLRPDNPCEYERVFVGDWIIRKQSGEFIRVRPQELDQDYEIQ